MKFFVLLVVFTVSIATSIAQPKFEVVGGETYDWGIVKPPSAGYLEGTIKMKNAGTSSMKIIEVRPGCGCTKTDPDKYELGPNEISSMNVKLNIGPSQGGPITKSITVTWADLDGIKAKDMLAKNGTPIPEGVDTNQHLAFMYLKADIRRPISILPTIYFAFSDLRIGVASTSKVEIVNNDDVPFTISNWETENGLIINQTGNVTLKPGDKVELVATVVPTQKGSYSGGLKFKTSHPDNQVMEVKAYGQVLESQSPVFQTNTPK